MTKAKEPRISRIVAACEEAWLAIHKAHEEVDPQAQIVVASRGRKSVLGYHAAQRWVLDGGPGARRTAKNVSMVAEVMVAAESLSNGAEEIFHTLLHEAVHSANWTDAIQDVSTGQYHNKHFAQRAGDMGLKVEYGGAQRGYFSTGLTPAAKNRYKAQIRKIRSSLSGYRTGEFATKVDRNLKVGACSKCGSKLRATENTIESGIVHEEDGGRFKLKKLA